MPNIHYALACNSRVTASQKQECKDPGPGMGRMNSIMGTDFLFYRRRITFFFRIPVPKPIRLFSAPVTARYQWHP